nr:venom metalloproteinase antarease-like TpachMP_B [Dermacentor andersoni]
MVSDSGDSYRAALTAAHEIAHALGSPHDGAETSKGCPESGRHLMNPYHLEKTETYSPCSLIAMNKFLNMPQAICLFGEVDINQPELGTRLENNPQLRHLRNKACGKRMSKGQVISHIQRCIKGRCR